MKKHLKQYIFFQRFIHHIGKILFLFLFLFISIRFFIISPGRVNGPSMEPTYIDNDTFYVKRLHLLFNKINRQDIVEVIHPETKVRVIKRIIGLPGETVEIRRGQVSIVKTDGTQFFLKEPYLKPYTTTRVWNQDKPVTYPLGDNEYFLLGDNRPHSIDSREYGPVHRSLIVGLIAESDIPEYRLTE